MEVHAAKSARRCTRLRVEIPVTVTSLDRRHPFASECMAIVVSPQGCGLRASQALPIETPILLNNLPGGGSASARVASCLPLGRDGQGFLIGASLYNSGNIWGIANPPEDWNCGVAAAAADSGKPAGASKQSWPYNVFSGHTETRPRRK